MTTWQHFPKSEHSEAASVKSFLTSTWPSSWSAPPLEVPPLVVWFPLISDGRFGQVGFETDLLPSLYDNICCAQLPTFGTSQDSNEFISGMTSRYDGGTFPKEGICGDIGLERQARETIHFMWVFGGFGHTSHLHTIWLTVWRITSSCRMCETSQRKLHVHRDLVCHWMAGVNRCIDL